MKAPRLAIGVLILTAAHTCVGAEGDEPVAPSPTVNEANVAQSAHLYLDYLNRPISVDPAGDVVARSAPLLEPSTRSTLDTDHDHEREVAHASALLISKRTEIAALPEDSSDEISAPEASSAPADEAEAASLTPTLLQIPLSTILAIVAAFFVLALIGLFRMDEELADRFIPFYARFRKWDRG